MQLIELKFIIFLSCIATCWSFWFGLGLVFGLALNHVFSLKTHYSKKTDPHHFTFLHEKALATTCFLKCTLVARCLHTINRQGNHTVGFFWDSFCPWPRKTIPSLHRCQTTFSSRRSKSHPSKMNFPRCCHGSSKKQNDMQLCTGPVSGSVRSHSGACNCVGG